MTVTFTGEPQEIEPTYLQLTVPVEGPVAVYLVPDLEPIPPVKVQVTESSPTEVVLESLQVSVAFGEYC